MDARVRAAVARRRQKIQIIQTLTKPADRKYASRKASERDVLFFALAWFPHLCRLNFAPMHWDLMRDYNRAIAPGILARTGRNWAIAAPRGAAKSTLVSLLFPLHAICLGLERYILIISATQNQARQRLRNLRRELRGNRGLIETFGPFESPDAVWTAGSLRVLGVQVDALSAGTEMRGVSLGAFRPTLIILDDVEDSEAVESVEQRAKLRQWFHEVVENLGDRYTRLWVIGTLLHPDSLLRALMRRPDFHARAYASIQQWAHNTTLWDEWRQLYTNLADERRQQTARRFFEEHRKAMMADARVLWPEKEDYYALMEQLVTRGRRAFFKEKQNDPAADAGGLFRLDRFAWFDVADGMARPAAAPDVAQGADTAEPEAPLLNFPSAPLDAMQTFGFLDPALGERRGAGDFAAIAVVGRDAQGALYVLDVWRGRAGPTEQAARALDLHEHWRFTAFGIEGNLFQQLLTIPLEQEAARRRQPGRPAPPRLPLRLVTHRTNKERRLMTLEPLIANGWLRFCRNLPRNVLLEFADFPRSAHDDAMDAIESAVALARQHAEPTRAKPLNPRPTKAIWGY